MFCTNCGANLIGENAAFCQSCGKAVGTLTISPPPFSQKFTKGWIYYFLAIMTVLAWFNALLFVYFGNAPPPAVILGSIFWTSCISAYIGKNAYSRGWVGLFCGFFIGVGGLAFCSLLTRILHS